MYYPYFRGKQNELLVIRETAKLMASREFVPIIEPVKLSFGPLEKALDEIVKAGGEAIVVVNPYHGDHSKNGSKIWNFLEEKYFSISKIKPGIIFNQILSTEEAFSIFNKYKVYNPVIIHAGFADPQGLAAKMGTAVGKSQHVFFEKHCGSMYRKQFYSQNQVLVRDGFIIQNNADYAPKEIFSDLHVTYQEEGFQGFGNFLIVTDIYKEKGGSAYAVAIHITVIDDDKQNIMYVYHFISDTNDTPTDPGKKFIEALKKLIEEADLPKSKIFEGKAMEELRVLLKTEHYPGLGYVKKIAMKHHIETLADFFS